MNQGHLEVLASPMWAEMLETNLVPWLEQLADLGDDVLEIGPGPGLTTDLLRQRTEQLTALELDSTLAGALAERLRDTNVAVVNGDAARTDFDSNRFTTVACFGMLHHLPTRELQDRVFAEVHRVLQPGGRFIGTDGIDSPGTRAFHEGDTYVPLDLATIVARLQAAGFDDVRIEPAEYEFRFQGRKRPSTSPGPRTPQPSCS